MSPTDWRFWSALFAAMIFLSCSAAADSVMLRKTPRLRSLPAPRASIRGNGMDAIWRLSTPIALPLITKRATWTTPSPTSMRRSGSIPNSPWPSTIEVPPTTNRATTTAPSPTTMRRSASIPNSPWPSPIGATPTATRATYDRAIADYNEAIRLDPKFAMAFHNRGIAYHDKGDIRPRHRRLQRGDPARSQIRHGLHQSRSSPTATRATRPRHRRLQ